MIVIDIETTGTDPDIHAIVSIGAVELENPSNDFYAECSIWDGAKVEAEALNINGFTFGDITDPSKQTLQIALEGLSTWIDTCRDKTLAGHNVGFDMNFLASHYKRCGLQNPFPKRTIDTHSLVYQHMIHRDITPPHDEKRKRSDITSDTVFSYVGLTTVRTTHNALEDAMLTAEAISRLLWSKPLFDQYKNNLIPWM